MVCVSWEDAQAYARWAGCELASEAQWERACRGPLGYAYPWGEAWEEHRCRHAGNNGNETTSAVYGYPTGVSGYGTYNQSGNVWEWCTDWYADTYGATSPTEDPAGPATGSARVRRGGSWGRDGPDGCRAAYRRWNSPGNRYVYQGFRLVRTAS